MSSELNENVRSERDAIIAEIHSAFGGVYLVNHGRTWSECDAADRYEHPDEAESRSERLVAWTKLVDDQKWDPFPGMGGFSFIDVAGLQYYLPPTMIRFLRGDNTEWYPGHLIGVIERLTDAEKLSDWTEAQVHCIARFISFMSRHDPELGRCTTDANLWLDALHRRWNTHLPQTPGA